MEKALKVFQFLLTSMFIVGFMCVLVALVTGNTN
jgi:hypothetical protein